MLVMWPPMAPGAVLAFAVSARTLLAIRRDGRPRPTESTDTIAIFGAAVHPAGPSRALRRRIDQAESLWRAGLATRIACCGGVTERSAMSESLLGHGIPRRALVEVPAASTRASIRALAALTTDAGSITAVSSPYHMHRILEEARRHGVQVLPAPSRLAVEAPLRKPPAWRILRNLAHMYVREVAACAWYALTSPRRWGPASSAVR